jgi:hypothetical protein
MNQTSLEDVLLSNHYIDEGKPAIFQFEKHNQDYEIHQSLNREIGEDIEEELWGCLKASKISPDIEAACKEIEAYDLVAITLLCSSKNFEKLKEESNCRDILINEFIGDDEAYILPSKSFIGVKASRGNFFGYFLSGIDYCRKVKI